MHFISWVSGVAMALAGGLPAAAQQIHEVSIQDYRYSPPALTVRRGDTVRWTNNEKRTSHSMLFTATAEESPRIFPGEHWSRHFAEPGQFVYRCGPHPEMEGRITVTE